MISNIIKLAYLLGFERYFHIVICMLKLLTSPEEMLNLKSFDLVELECCVCHKPFTRQKRVYLRGLRGIRNNTSTYCGPKCSAAKLVTKATIVCAGCSNTCVRTKSQISTRNFCSSSCAASYNNKHKTHGNRRSKLEKWLEEQLAILYPELEIHFNKKDAIGSELDIYIPSLKLAFELNGIFHFEPIYGQSKLNQIQANDVSKSKLCHEFMIDLCIIDTSGQKYVTPKTSQVFLDIITSIINDR